MLLKNVSVNGAEENAEAPPLSSPGLPVQHVPVPLLPGSGALSGLYISDKLTILHGQSDHLSRRFRSLISERDSRRSKSFL